MKDFNDWLLIISVATLCNSLAILYIKFGG